MNTQRAEDRSRSVYMKEATLMSDGHFCVHSEKILVKTFV